MCLFRKTSGEAEASIRMSMNLLKNQAPLGLPMPGRPQAMGRCRLSSVSAPLGQEGATPGHVLAQPLTLNSSDDVQGDAGPGISS